MEIWRVLLYVVLVRALVYVLRKLLFKKKQAPPSAVNINEQQLKALHERWYTSVKGLGATGKQYLVIGTGFLGSRLLGALVLRGEQNIRAFDINIPASLRAQYPGVAFIQGNVTDMEAVRAACRGVDVVYSTFAVIRYWERQAYQLPASMSVNVEGTNTVVEACIAENVPMLISTSTSNVCVTNEKKRQEFDENTPYVNNVNAPNHYAYTKAEAEKLVLNANNKPLGNGQHIITAAVRPCSGIFGAKDRLVLQRVLTNGRYEIISIGVLNWVYIENVTWGHLLMEKALSKNPQEVGGKAIGVSNDCEGTILDLFAEAQKLRPDLTLLYLPSRLMMAIADGLDFIRSIVKHRMPAMGELDWFTRASFETAGMNYVLKSKLAEKLLGYRPLFTIPESVLLSVAEFERGSYF